MLDNQIPIKADKTVQSATFPFQLDKVYEVTLYKTINGSVKYAVEVHNELEETRIEIVTNTILNLCNTLGAFDPKKES